MEMAITIMLIIALISGFFAGWILLIELASSIGGILSVGLVIIGLVLTIIVIGAVEEVLDRI